MPPTERQPYCTQARTAAKICSDCDCCWSARENHLFFRLLQLLFDSRLFSLERFSLDIPRQITAAFLSQERKKEAGAPGHGQGVAR